MIYPATQGRTGAGKKFWFTSSLKLETNIHLLVQLLKNSVNYYPPCIWVTIVNKSGHSRRRIFDIILFQDDKLTIDRIRHDNLVLKLHPRVINFDLLFDVECWYTHACMCICVSHCMFHLYLVVYSRMTIFSYESNSIVDEILRFMNNT